MVNLLTQENNYLHLMLATRECYCHRPGRASIAPECLTGMHFAMKIG